MQIKIGNKIYKTNHEYFEYYDDLIKLQQLMEELGFPKIDLEEIKDMWQTISNEHYASWLCVPNSKEDLVSYLEEIQV